MSDTLKALTALQRSLQSAGELQSFRASTVTPEAIEWLWLFRFALGKLGLIVGLPDEGKGLLTADIISRVTRGDEWPCKEGIAPKGNVILLTAEDDIEDTVVPRLLAAGADLSRVEIVRMVEMSADKKRMFSLITDLNLLRKKIEQVGDVILVIIDPITAYLGTGKIDSFRTTDVRSVLAPVVDLAAELALSFIGVMHFNKKVDVTNALLRISDSLAFGATARHVYAVVDDAENKRKLFVKAKNNLSPSNFKSLAYGFSTKVVGQDAKSNAPISAPYIVWDINHVDVTATEAMSAATEAKSPAARDAAKQFLRDLLADGPVKRTEIEEAADANGISERTLFRAKADLQVMAKRDGPGGCWTWKMPPSYPAQNQHKEESQ
jgi:putative DNA primase/helicase